MNVLIYLYKYECIYYFPVLFIQKETVLIQALYPFFKTVYPGH